MPDAAQNVEIKHRNEIHKGESQDYQRKKVEY